MADTLKTDWKKVGKDFASLGKDLGTTLVKSVRKGVSVATEWAQDKPEGDPIVVDEVVEEPKEK